MKRFSKKSLICAALLCIIGSVVLVGCGSNEVADSKKEKSKNEKPYYYNEENKERYEAYSNKHPKLSEDEVIWRVEADIDKTPYKDMKLISKEDENNDILLVNKHFCFRDDFEPKDLKNTGNGQMATSKTVDAYKKMASDAKKEGLALNVRSGYRSIAHQRRNYSNCIKAYGKEYTNDYIARPTTSEHHTGRALDLVDDKWDFDTFDKSESCKWLHKNAWKYGFILRYQKDITKITGYAYESWHVTYVGEEAAKTMHDEGIKSLEEYWVKYIKYTPQ